MIYYWPHKSCIDMCAGNGFLKVDFPFKMCLLTVLWVKNCWCWQMCSLMLYIFLDDPVLWIPDCMAGRGTFLFLLIIKKIWHIWSGKLSQISLICRLEWSGLELNPHGSIHWSLAKEHEQGNSYLYCNAKS